MRNLKLFRLRLKILNQKVSCAAVPIGMHPSSAPERFTEHIETVLHSLARENKNIFILGDFNINQLNCVIHPASENSLNMMNSNYLLPYILQPTRVTDRSATLIDNIFANTFNFNALSGNLVTKISDHFPQFLIIEDLEVNYASLNYYKHDYSHFCEETFVEETFVDEVSHLNFSSSCNSDLNTNGKFDLFYDQIDSVCKKHVPYKRLSKKEVNISSKPWVTREIFAKMKYGDKLYSKLVKSKQPVPNLHYLYKKFRNRVVKELKDSKSTYFNQHFSLNKYTCNMQKLWSGIRSIINVGKCKNSYITSIISNSGPYSVPVTILKTVRDYISEPLAFLVNDSFASGNFPEKLKLARNYSFFLKGLKI